MKAKFKWSNLKEKEKSVYLFAASSFVSGVAVTNLVYAIIVSITGC